MKQYSKKLFSLVVLCGTASSMLLHARDNDNNNHGNRVVPFLQWRSQGRDMARKLYGTTAYAVYQGDMDGTYGTFNATIQYDQNFRHNQITECLFGPAVINNFSNNGNTNSCDDSCNNDVIMISGLNAADLPGTTTRGPRELMAENFLLPRDFRSVISFSPRVQDVVFDLNLYVGFDRWVNGLYFRLYGPVVWNKASLRAKETVLEEGTEGYTQGYFDPNTEVPRDALFNGALEFFGGCPFLADYTDASVSVQPLRFAKFSNCNLTNTTNNCDDECNSSSRHKTGFAELRGEFGYNYIAEKYRFLINLQAAAPTGTKVKAEYLFPAQVGNGHHWELGVGLGGAWRMWCNEDMERSFNFIVEADITHLFNAKQQRTFDLKCKPLSRYMLAERLVSNTDNPADDRILQSDVQFDTAEDAAAQYAPVANFSTRDVKVSIGVQGDLVAMFNYTCRGFSWDLGYNFWAMSSSKIKISCDDDCDTACGIVPFPVNTWALKGDASIAGYNPANAPAGGVVIGLAATESEATIFTGTNAAAGQTAALANPNVDGATPATFNNAATPPVAQPLFVFNDATPVVSVAINTSVDPVFISIDDLDVAGAEQRGLSHKVFTHFSYTWTNHDKWVPYVGAGFSAEFGSHSGSGDDCNTTTIECDNCPSALSCALSKWAVEVKGGVSFH